MAQFDWNLSDWNDLSDGAQQSTMHDAHKSKTKLKIGGKTYSIDSTFDGRFALLPSGFLALIRRWRGHSNLRT